MIKEFAVEPEAIVGSYRDFCYFVEKFGVEHGRVIGRFPKKWKALVRRAAEVSLGGTVEYLSLINRLENIQDNVIFPSNRPSGDGELTWIDRALFEHRREPFAGIVARESRAREPQVLEARTLDDTDVRFLGFHSAMVRRKAVDIAGSVEFLLRNASNVKLIDPYINPSRGDYRRPIEHMLAAVRQHDAVIEMHVSDHFDSSWLVQQLDRWLADARPAGVVVKVYQHKLSAMHNRYVLTEHGGVMFGVGLNDAEDGEGVAEDDVTLMAEEARLRRWDEFSSEEEIKVWRDDAVGAAAGGAA